MKKNTLYYILKYFIDGFVSACAGFGLYFIYFKVGYGVFFSMFMGMLFSSIVMVIFNNSTSKMNPKQSLSKEELNKSSQKK